MDGFRIPGNARRFIGSRRVAASVECPGSGRPSAELMQRTALQTRGFAKCPLITGPSVGGLGFWQCTWVAGAVSAGEELLQQRVEV